MQLQEGSTVPITCAMCGKETFQITLIPGTQKMKCHNFVNCYTLIELTKDNNDNLILDVKAI